ncbi:MAG: phage tail protein [Proteobacteria bacterium]|nr:phage tail protein [Pseudomonadota bacterium]
MTTALLQPVITEAGLAAIFNATQDGFQGKITHIALGDSGYSPAQTQTKLRTEKARHAISDGEKLGTNHLHLTAIADGKTEFWVREVGFYLDSGVLLAVWSDPKSPLAYKSAGVDLLLAYDLLLEALPANSVTVESSGAGLNLTLAGPLAALAAGQISEQLRGVERDDQLATQQQEQVKIDRTLTYLTKKVTEIDQQNQLDHLGLLIAVASNATAAITAALCGVDRDDLLITLQQRQVITDRQLKYLLPSNI